jgi:hypothetical protein
LGNPRIYESAGKPALGMANFTQPATSVERGQRALCTVRGSIRFACVAYNATQRRDSSPYQLVNSYNQSSKQRGIGAARWYSICGFDVSRNVN